MSDRKISDLPLASSINVNDVSILVKNGVDYKFAFSALLQLIGSNLNVGINISFGTVLPQNSSGNNGDAFINTDTGSFAQKVSGIWTIVYTLPSTTSITDGTVLYGIGIPGNTIGNNNDTYINTGTGVFYKKNAGTWNQVFSMQTGPAGSPGANGTNGLNGSNGFSILNGTGNPSNLSTGINGDFYINTTNYTLFGPKTSGNWETGITLIGNGVPIGGTSQQVLSKLSNADFDTNWVDRFAGLSAGDIATALGYTVESNANKGIANGYAGLDGTGRVPSSQLPSFVDDVIEAATFTALPTTGETGKIYVTIDTNFEYRWSGSTYIRIVASPGTTDALVEGTTNLYYTDERIAMYGNIHYGLLSNPLSQFASTTSVQLAGIISDETGTGALVFANSPTFINPTLGIAAATELSTQLIYNAGTSTNTLTLKNYSGATTGFVIDANGMTGTITVGATFKSASVSLDVAAPAGFHNVNTYATTTNRNTNIYGFIAQNSIAATNTANITGLYGLVGVYISTAMSAGATGTLSSRVGIVNNFSNASAMNITNAYGYRVNSLSNTGGGTITGFAQIALTALSVATNDVYLLLGTDTIPTGNWSIYSTTSSATYHNGNFQLGNITATAGAEKLQVTGAASISNGLLVGASVTVGSTLTPNDIVLKGTNSSSGGGSAISIYNGASQIGFIGNYSRYTAGTYDGRFMVQSANALYLNAISQNVVIGAGTDDGINKFQVNGSSYFNDSIKATQYNLSALNTAPFSSADTGVLGEIRIDADYIYVCKATNAWVRATLSTF